MVKKSDVDAALKKLKSAAKEKVSTSKIDAFPKNLKTRKYELDNDYATDIKGANEVSTSFGKHSTKVSDYANDIKKNLKSIKSSVEDFEVNTRLVTGTKDEIPNDLK